MKFTFSLFLLLFTYGVASAQNSGQPGKDVTIRICAPSKGNLLDQPPLCVVILKGQEVFRKKTGTDSLMNTIKPDDIKAIEVLKDSVSTKKYGQAAKNGVIIITLKDEKFPNGLPAYKATN